jgi:hypothetical protein
MIDHVHEILTLYCEYLNRWMEADENDTGHRYAPEQFTTYDAERNLFGSITAPIVIPNEYHGLDLYILDMSDGDDGGPTTLHVMFNRDLENSKIVHMIQIFDTMPAEIYNTQAGGFQRMPDTPES